MVTTKIRYISDKSVYLEKGEVYLGMRAKNDTKGRFWCVYIEEDDEPGWYAFPSEHFEVVE